uniref:Uncharacterized protein n=1 Tax=Aegilops tauschii subsp. strangulata TaxID=200361 RepID=A0A453I9N7_AEGTS
GSEAPPSPAPRRGSEAPPSPSSRAPPAPSSRAPPRAAGPSCSSPLQAGFCKCSCAVVHIHPSQYPSDLDSTNSTLKKNKVNDIRGLQNLAKSLSAQGSVTSSGLGFLEERKGSSEDADHAEVDGDETTTPVGKGSDRGTSSWRRREGGVRQF